MNMVTMAGRTHVGLVSAWHAEGSDQVNVRYFDRAEDGSAQWSDVEQFFLSNYPQDGTLWDWMMSQWNFDVVWYGMPIPRAEFADV
jgi:hypothetical protein